MQNGRIYCFLNDAGKVVGHTYTQKVNALRAWRRMPAYKLVVITLPCDLSRIDELGQPVTR